MELLEIVKRLEKCSNRERFEIINETLNKIGVSFSLQKYSTGENILIIPEGKERKIGIGSHFDVVPGSGGANDNASAVAVCLEILNRLKSHSFKNINICVFFFDEEESGLKGSEAFVKEYGVSGFAGLINLEMVGQGNKFALWPLEGSSGGKTLSSFEKAAHNAGIFSRRFDKIVTNSSDHVNFRKGGLEDAFSVTCISDKELEVSKEYYQGQKDGLKIEELREIMRKAPLFQHYHQPTDLSHHLSEAALQMTADTVWSTLEILEKDFRG